MCFSACFCNKSVYTAKNANIKITLLAFLTNPLQTYLSSIMKSRYDLKCGIEVEKKIYTATKIRWGNANRCYVGTFLQMIFTASYSCAIKTLGICSVYQTPENTQNIFLTCLLGLESLFIMLTLHLTGILLLSASTAKLGLQVLCCTR
jgi:hypothetical protein